MPEELRRKGRPKRFSGEPSQPTIQALDRALDVLILLQTREGITLSEIARELDQSVATIHRVLSTLEAREFVETNAASQEWHIGPAAFRVGSAFLRRRNVVERSRPIMRELMQRTGETSNLGVEWNDRVLFVSQMETHQPIRAFFRPGTVAPLYASGIGKALLTTYPAEKLAAYLETAELERFTEKTLTSVAELSADLDKSRARGYVVDDEERTEGMRCVAAPIYNDFGEAIAAISVSGPTARMPGDKIETLGEAVRDAAATVSHLIGAGGRDR
ncbi:IclR family transcriptional regulator [Nisaea acidiphila]|uniref:IclR family transcriptional regulator n=1 Tax=Nisaea acidiphila TaxID=1862145 RepID=A0A9J7AND3_9PROT|nr:HTH-type transcriptional regulator BhcR [Nisaea acidiphila]UUX48097.1 IclR family transcriptional regulator [Nisaea acidiphila]